MSALKLSPVSVVIPCYQCAKTIVRAVTSVDSQTYRPVEVILVDDASGDGTVELIKSLQDQYGDWLKIVEMPENVGAGSARNAGWSLATQPYIAFLDSDDAWHPRKIEIQYAFMKDNPDVSISGHGHVKLSNQYSPIWPDINLIPKLKYVTELKALLSNPFATRTVMLKRETLYRFKENKRYIEDYLLWMQIILSPLPAAYINLALAASFKADFGQAGLSANLWKMEKGELDAYFQIYREKKIGMVVTTLLFCYSILKYIRRILISNLK